MTHPSGADMRAAVGDMVADLLDAVREASEAVELERHVLPFLVSYEQVRPTVDLDEALVSSFSETGSPEAANALAVVESFATEPLAKLARGALGRLRERGIEPELDGAVGDAELKGVWRIAGREDPSEFLLAFLERPGQPGPQACLTLVDRGRGEGALTTCALLPPKRLDELDRFVSNLRSEWRLGEPEAISGDELRAAVRGAVDRAAALRLGADLDSAAALAVLGRALAGDAQAFAGLEVDPPDTGNFRPGSEAEAEEMIAGFIREYLAALSSFEPAARSGEAVTYTALRWKWDRDAALRRWRATDVVELLLRELPESMAEAPVAPEDVPACLDAVFLTMDERGLLEGDGYAALSAAVERTAERFLEALEEVVGSSPGDALMRQMVREGVDPTDADAVAAWTAEFNERSFAERDAVVGPAIERRKEADAGRAAAEQRKARRGKRRATRQARRRNRG